MKGAMKNKMNEARLNELMPDFDKDAEWNKVAGKLGQAATRKPFSWRIAASILVLIAAVSLLAVMAGSDNSTDLTSNNDTTQTENWSSEVASTVPAMHTYAAVDAESEMKAGNEIRSAKTPNEINKTLPIRNKMPGAAGYKRTEEFVCNGTPCPLEICIIQTIRCKDKAPSAIATCNTLEPDQARQLHYRAPEAVDAHCKVTVDEIRIRRVTTGETIVLNAHSQPSTAQELFNCITGKEKCNLLAGIFESDCNDQQRSHGLKIDNSMGSLIME
jgi:hypothetical protein